NGSRRGGNNRRMVIRRVAKLREQRFLRAFEKILNYLAQRLCSRVFGSQHGTIYVSAARFVALDNALARKPVHDGHDGGVRARESRSEAFANLANRGFADGPECFHAIELERRKIEQRMFRRMRLGDTFAALSEGRVSH